MAKHLTPHQAAHHTGRQLESRNRRCDCLERERRRLLEQNRDLRARLALRELALVNALAEIRRLRHEIDTAFIDLAH
jgi:hypothetical protein